MTRWERLLAAVWDQFPLPIQNWIYDRRPDLGRRLDDLANRAENEEEP